MSFYTSFDWFKKLRLFVYVTNNSTNINKKDNYLLLQSIENKTELDIWHGNLGPGLTHVASNRSVAGTDYPSGAPEFSTGF
jgi:hypothetical protein